MNTINKNVNLLITAICKRDGIMKKDLAERLGTTDISLSLTLSPSGNVITTKKLIEIATALNRKVVVGILTDEEIAEMSNKELTPLEGEFTCPTCGVKYELKPIVEEKKETSTTPTNFVIFDKLESDKEARTRMVEKMLKTRQEKQEAKK